MMTFPGSLYWLTPWESSVYRSSICCLRRPRVKDVLTLSLSGLRRDPHSALLDTGGDGHGLAGGRLSLGEPLTAGADFWRVSAAQSNLAFLGMWRCSTRPDLAELLPFDADAGSSSNMASSQPGRPLRQRPEKKVGIPSSENSNLFIWFWWTIVFFIYTQS